MRTRKRETLVSQLTGAIRQESRIDDSELAATRTAGYKPTELKSVDQYAQLDAQDESLARWKASLGLSGAAASASSGPRVKVTSLSLKSSSRALGPIVLDLTQPDRIAAIKKEPVRIKVISCCQSKRLICSFGRCYQEGAEYAVELQFNVNEIVTGLKYIQVNSCIKD